jgi:hypothetical protein
MIFIGKPIGLTQKTKLVLPEIEESRAQAKTTLTLNAMRSKSFLICTVMTTERAQS